MIIDLIPFCGENDLLEIRTHELKGIVDKTILLESNFSHTLIPKPLFFAESKERFSNFDIDYIVKDFNYSNPFHADWAGRHALLEAIPNQHKNSDLILITGDLDEIPESEKLKDTISHLQEISVLESKYSFFCCDLFGRMDFSNVILKYNWIRDDFYKYRDNRQQFKKVFDAGYHFSSCGTVEQISRKWKYFAHASEIYEKYKDPEYIKSQIRRKCGSWDEFAPNDQLKQIDINYDNLPRFLVDNREKFKHLFYDFYKI